MSSLSPILHEDCSELEVNKWILSDFIVNKLLPIVSFTPFPLDELQLMTTAVCKFKPALIFEWGTNIGKSARIFYEITKQFNIASEIHSVDLPDEVSHNEHPGSRRGELVKGLHQVILHQGDGLKTTLGIWEKSLEIWKKSGRKGNVLFFLDGDHSYSTVKLELETILTRIPQAKVLLHDTFYQSAESGYNIGPYSAIQEIVKKLPDNYKVISTQMGLPGMTLVYK